MIVLQTKANHAVTILVLAYSGRVLSNISTCRAASVVIAAKRMNNTNELRSPSFLLMAYPVKGHVGMESVSAVIDPL